MVICCAVQKPKLQLIMLTVSPRRRLSPCAGFTDTSCWMFTAIEIKLGSKSLRDGDCAHPHLITRACCLGAGSRLVARGVPATRSSHRPARTARHSGAGGSGPTIFILYCPSSYTGSTGSCMWMHVRVACCFLGTGCWTLARTVPLAPWLDSGCALPLPGWLPPGRHCLGSGWLLRWLDTGWVAV